MVNTKDYTFTNCGALWRNTKKNPQKYPLTGSFQMNEYTNPKKKAMYLKAIEEGKKIYVSLQPIKRGRKTMYQMRFGSIKED